MAEERKTIVLDNGSLKIRAGFAGDEEHKVEMVNVVGRAKARQVPSTGENYVGGEALSQVGLQLQHDCPVQKGVVTNWEDMQTIWQYIFDKELAIKDSMSEHPILVTEPLLDHPPNRKKMSELLFEVFNFPALYIARQSVASMYATGETTGLLLQSGDGVTEVMAMVEGFMLPESVQRFALAGADMTAYLASKLTHQSDSPLGRTTADPAVVRDIKEKLCYLTYPQLVEPPTEEETSYQLPNGEKLQMSPANAASIFEAMFQPEVLTGEMDGVQQTLHTAVNKCDIDSRKKLWGNIILAGGNTMAKGFAERLKAELAPLVPSTVTINVKAPEERQFSAWKGASLMASLPTFQQLLVSKAEYEESGMDIVNRKCI